MAAVVFCTALPRGSMRNRRGGVRDGSRAAVWVFATNWQEKRQLATICKFSTALLRASARISLFQERRTPLPLQSLALN